jgi:hypothetical protein
MKARDIFHYHDGTRARSICPLTVDRRLSIALGPKFRERIASLGDKPPFGLVGLVVDKWHRERAELEDTIIKAICAAFDVTVYDDHGGTSKPTGLPIVKIRGLYVGWERCIQDMIASARPLPNSRSRDSPSPTNLLGPNNADSTSVEIPSPVSEPASPAMPLPEPS